MDKLTSAIEFRIAMLRKGLTAKRLPATTKADYESRLDELETLAEYAKPQPPAPGVATPRGITEVGTGTASFPKVNLTTK